MNKSFLLVFLCLTYYCSFSQSTITIQSGTGSGAGGTSTSISDSLTSGTVTTQSSKAIDLSSFYNKYREIEINIYDYIPSGDNSELWLNTSTDGSTYDNSSGDYSWNYHSGYTTSDVTTGTGATSAYIRRVGSDIKISAGSAIGNASTNDNHWKITLTSMNRSAKHNIKFTCSYSNTNSTSEPVELDGIGTRKDAGLIKGIELTPSTGTFSFYYIVKGSGRL